MEAGDEASRNWRIHDVPSPVGRGRGDLIEGRLQGQRRLGNGVAKAGLDGSRDDLFGHDGPSCDFGHVSEGASEDDGWRGSAEWEWEKGYRAVVGGVAVTPPTGERVVGDFVGTCMLCDTRHGCPRGDDVARRMT